MKLLDLAKFQKVGEDKHCVKMRHDDGHEMTILIAALPKIQREQLGRLKMAKGGDVRHFDTGTTPDNSLQAEPIDPNSAEAQAAPAPSMPDQAQVAAPTAVPAGNPLQQQAQSILQAQQQGITGAAQQRDVDIAKANAMLPIEQEQVQAEADRKQQIADNTAQVQKATSDFNTYMTLHGKVDPNQFGKNLSTEGKISTVLGLILGGFGGGMSGTGVNPAMNWLMDQQNKSIAAQQNEQGNQRNVLGAYQDLFKNKEAAVEASRISDNNRLTHQAAAVAAKLGTPQALANYNKFVSDLAMKNDAATQRAAGYLAADPTRNVVSQAQPGATGTQHQPSGDGILSPDAQRKYQLLQYDPRYSPQQKSDIQDQYGQAVQTDKALKQVDALYPQLAQKATWGGYLASKAPLIGGMAGALTEGLGLAGTIPTAGTSLIGAIPGAVAAGAATAGGVKQLGNAIGGQQEQQYQDARDALTTIIGSALGPNAHLTPSEIGSIAEQYIPTKMDSPETQQDKLEKLKTKIKTLAKTSALDSAGMTNR